MPGSWELRNHPRVLGYTLNTELVTLAWAYGLRNLIFPGDWMPIAGRPFDMARNDACMRCLEGGYDWLFSLDSDVIPPRDAVIRLLRHQKPVISGLYARRSPPHGLPVMQRPVGQWITKYKPGSVIEVDTVGAGCLLIHRSVLEKMPAQRPEAGKHWFDWAVDCPPQHAPNGTMSEDFSFCIHVKRTLVVSVLVDTSVVCRHVGAAEATPGSFVPLNTTPIT